MREPYDAPSVRLPSLAIFLDSCYLQPQLARRAAPFVCQVPTFPPEARHAANLIFCRTRGERSGRGPPDPAW